MYNSYACIAMKVFLGLPDEIIFTKLFLYSYFKNRMVFFGL